MDAYGATKDKLFQTPKITTKIRLWRYQWFGVSFLFIIPILALFGVFGTSSKKITRFEGGVEAIVTYPTTVRYGQSNTLQIELINRSGDQIDGLTTRFNANYINRFSEVSFVPEIQKSYEVDVRNLSPGKSRFILVQLKAKDYGRHNGEVVISKAGLNLFRINLNTMVFP